eukprot:TRINITY_DN2602_c0_g2_i2.p1 TRINITY_DN2602_c0_g2~~TRINITY_DN2602_c0_g2_i2.p1  ORF type:complete len:421 (-),score=71.92 TRINITY_DN2602_c0_g2_i2:367-1629(-)
MALNSLEPTDAVEKEPEQVHVTSGEVLELTVRNALTGDVQRLDICSCDKLRDLQTELFKVFNIPPFEQALLSEEGDTVFGTDRFDNMRPISSVPALCAGVPLMIARSFDTRPQAERNCAFLEALQEGKLDEAMNLLDSSGAPVDPNCSGSFRHDGRSFLEQGGRDFGDIRSARTPALCTAVMARCTWSPAGQVTGELADDESVVRVVERLLALGASVDEMNTEVHTCGSWPAENVSKTALYLAVQTRSVGLVRLLLDAGADPTKGLRKCQFAPAISVPSEAALRRQPDDSLTQELRSLLRRKEYEVNLSHVDAPRSTRRVLGIKVSRRDGYWGFIDEIEPDALIAEWNQHQSEDKRVKVNDKIMAVCGQRAGVDFKQRTGFLVDEQEGWDGKDGVDCYLASLLLVPKDDMVFTLSRAEHP